METNQSNQAPLRDDELTAEQLKKRNKNREQKERQRAAKTGQSNPSTSFTTTQEPAAKPASVRKMPERLTDEEYTQQQIDRKSSRIARNPKGSVVSTAETSESRSLAFKIDEINIITEHTRANIGTERVSYADGEKILKFFKHNISDNVDRFLNLAYSFDIGSKRARIEYKETERKARARDAQIAAQRGTSIVDEIASETKERETHEKAVEKSASELERAQDVLNKAQEALLKAQETHVKTIAEQDTAYAARILVQKERKIAENNERAEQNRLAAEANKTQQSEAADTAGKEDNTNTQQA
jgi:hypothetical protein